MLRIAGPLAAAMLLAGAAVAAPDQKSAVPTSATGEPKICKHVVSAEPGAKPYELCMTKAEWTAKNIADARNVNRVVCRYEQSSRSRFRSTKVCMTAAEWENQRQLERQAVERIQMSTCVAGAGC